MTRNESCSESVLRCEFSQMLRSVSCWVYYYYKIVRRKRDFPPGLHLKVCIALMDLLSGKVHLSAKARTLFPFDDQSFCFQMIRIFPFSGRCAGRVANPCSLANGTGLIPHMFNVMWWARRGDFLGFSFTTHGTHSYNQIQFSNKDPGAESNMKWVSCHQDFTVLL